MIIAFNCNASSALLLFRFRCFGFLNWLKNQNWGALYCFCSTLHEIRVSLKLAKPVQVAIKKARAEQGCFAAVHRNVDAMWGSVRTTVGHWFSRVQIKNDTPGGWCGSQTDEHRWWLRAVRLTSRKTLELCLQPNGDAGAKAHQSFPIKYWFIGLESVKWQKSVILRRGWRRRETIDDIANMHSTELPFFSGANSLLQLCHELLHDPQAGLDGLIVHQSDQRAADRCDCVIIVWLKGVGFGPIGGGMRASVRKRR